MVSYGEPTVPIYENDFRDKLETNEDGGLVATKFIPAGFCTAFVGYIVTGKEHQVKGYQSVLTVGGPFRRNVILNANPDSTWVKRYVNDVYFAHLAKRAKTEDKVNAELRRSEELDGSVDGTRFNSVFLYTLKDIASGEEILISSKGSRVQRPTTEKQRLKLMELESRKATEAMLTTKDDEATEPVSVTRVNGATKRNPMTREDRAALLAANIARDKLKKQAKRDRSKAAAAKRAAMRTRLNIV